MFWKKNVTLERKRTMGEISLKSDDKDVKRRSIINECVRIRVMMRKKLRWVADFSLDVSTIFTSKCISLLAIDCGDIFLSLYRDDPTLIYHSNSKKIKFKVMIVWKIKQYYSAAEKNSRLPWSFMGIIKRLSVCKVFVFSHKL